jgi:hypothetical protein
VPSDKIKTKKLRAFTSDLKGILKRRSKEKCSLKIQCMNAIFYEGIATSWEKNYI